MLLLLLASMATHLAQAHHYIEVIRGVDASGATIELDARGSYCLDPGQKIAIAGEWINLANQRQNHLLGIGARWFLKIDQASETFWIAGTLPTVYFDMASGSNTTVVFTAPESFSELSLRARETERGELLRFVRTAAGAECNELPAGIIR